MPLFAPWRIPEIWRIWVLCILLIAYSHSSKLNVPQLLLPYSTHASVNFTLKAETGCYTCVLPLSLSAPSSFPPLSSCSQHALVSALPTLKTPTQRSAIVLAKNTATGQILRCDVYISYIRSIQILTTTHQIFTDDPPLQLSVQALDSKGNTFSSLAGLEFEWHAGKEHDAPGRVRFLPYSEAGYCPSPHILSLEKAGHRGEDVLLLGLESGPALIYVSLKHPEYEHVDPVSVSLSIIDRVYMSPSEDTFLLPGSTITYKMWRSLQCSDTGKTGETRLQCSDTGKTGETRLQCSDTEVPLSEDGYLLVAESRAHSYDSDQRAEVIGVDRHTVTAKNLGLADSASLLPSHSVFVVEPSYLTLDLEEEVEDRWVLETGRQYHVTVRIHDSHGHITHMSENVELALSAGDHVQVLSSSSDLFSHALLAQTPGHTLLQATLLTVLSEDGYALPLDLPIRVKQEVDVYDPLTVEPSVSVFPWQPSSSKPYHYLIKVRGGSGSVVWGVSDTSVATVTIKGEVIAGNKIGQAEILAADARKPLHTAVGQVHVLRPGQLKLLPQRGDCWVGETVELPLAVWGDRIPDLPHHSLPVPEQHVTQVTQVTQVQCDSTQRSSLPPSADSCGGVRLEALAPGHTLITVTVETDQYNISATATLAAYSPLKALVSDVLLTVGVSRVLLFEGGPQPWPLDHSRFYAEAWAEPPGGAIVEPLSHSETGRLGHTYRVTCTAEGEQRVMFRCGNSAGELSWAPCEEEVGVQVWCGAAAHVSITPLLTTTHPSTCPPPHYPSTPLPVSSTRDTMLQVAVFDHKGEQFDNFTFSSLVWSSSNPSLLSLSPEPTLVDIIDIPNEKKQYKVHGRLVCQAHGQTGAVTVTAQISWSSVGGSVTLRLVEDVQWASRSITLYNHPLVTENLTLVQGSGHFVVSLQDKELANVTYLEKTNTVQVSPLRAGISSLKVYDLCLTPVDRGSTMAITVSDITDFRIDFMDIVEVGHSALVRVQVLDSHQQPFLHHFLSLMDLKLLPSSSIITVESVGPLDKVSVGFRIFGQAVGVATLHLSAVDRNGAVINSAHKHMQVYPQFTLQPRKLSLALRSIRQVKWEGGPHPQSSVGFSVSDSDIAMVTDTGLVKGVSVGVARLRGALETILQDTGALLTFAQDEVEVEVFELTGVRIQAPLVRLTVGTEMPVYVMGSDSSQSPLSLGSVESGLSFHWSLGKLGVLEIIPRHTRAGISVSHTHSFSVLVRAWAAGRTTLKVCVRTSPTDSPAEDGRSHCPFSDEIHILVFEEMKLAAGSPQSILMSPHSTYSLQSNKDSICPMRYTLHQSVQGHGLVTVDDQGVLKAGSKTGAALLEVIATETCGVNQTLLISVKVAAVWFVQVFSDSTLHSEREASLPAFPLGWSIHIRARCYDNLGQEFHAHDIPIRITTNRDDLVQITPGSDSHSFVVQTVSPGLTVLGVQGDATNPSLSDYTPLPVLPAITDPPASVRPGDVICFSSPLTGQQGQPGTWNVSSSRILQIDTNTGVALAKHAGTVVLYNWLGVGQQALKEVTVEPLATPTLTPPKDTHLTNWPQAPGYVVNVDLNTSVANSAQCSVDQSEAILQRLKPEEELLCSLHFSAPYQQLKTLQSVFSTTPQYNRDTGQYSCRISVHPESDAALPVLSTLPLSASLSAGLRGQSAIPGLLVTLPYVPAFHCPHTQVSLSPRQPEAQITVQGVHHMLSTLKFYSESPAVSLSGPVVSEQEPALLKASVRTSHWHRPSDEAPLSANVTVYSSLFAQTHNITVTLLTDRRTRLAETSQTDAGVFSQLWDFQLILTFALFAVLAVTATLFIVYNTIVSQFTASPSANTAPAVRGEYLDPPDL
ncbi:nuclear pore membrane glycoprotein 210 [Alosa pseudoharengus]|uniref:nuclear pore membrane glycoprotein 210 n=1 Tax=Alosa pseudoharengus TaxID=34774 RepID=UPI003F8BFDDF